MKAPLVLLAALFIASAHQTLLGDTDGDWTYSVSDNQATITIYSGAGGALDFPSVVSEIPAVTAAGSWPPIFGTRYTTASRVPRPGRLPSRVDDAFHN